MKYFISISLIILIIGTSFFFYKNKDKFLDVPKDLEDIIIEYDLDKNYPQTPQEIVDLYNKILKYYYGVDDDKEKDNRLKEVLEVQRKLIASRLLQQNPVDVHLAHLKEEINQYRNEKKIFIEAKKGYVQFDSKDSQQAKVKVVQFFNQGDNVYLEYTLIKEESKWKILSWREVPKFEISKKEKDIVFLLFTFIIR